MEKQIRTVDQQKGIVQITTVDERWYARPSADPMTKLPVYQFVPSVTWIAEHYPKGIGFYKWLAQTGWDEAQALKEAAGDKGSKVHAAIAALLAGQTVKMDDLLINPSTGQPEPLTLDEYQAAMSFAAWHQAVRPELVAQDVVIWNDIDGYAGTVDAVFRFANALWVVDFKTSKAIYASHRMQVSAYRQAVPEWTEAKLGILQLGYARNRDGYKFTEVDGCYPLFLAAKQIWAEETKGQYPSQKDYPLALSLAPVAPAVDGKGADMEPTTGGSHGTTGGRTENGGVRKVVGGRVVNGSHRGSAVRPGAQAQKQK